MLNLNGFGSGKKLEVTIKTGTLIRVFISIFIFLVILGFLNKIRFALLLIVVSFFLALALNAPVHWLATRLPHRKNHEHRVAATIISFLVVIIILGSFIAAVAPPIVSQTKNFINSVPDYVNSLQDKNSEASLFIRKHHLESEVRDFSDKLKSHLDDLSGTAVSKVPSVIQSIVDVLTVLVLTFLMLIEGPGWLRYGYKLLPEKHEKHAEKLALEMYSVVRGYVNGQVILAAIAALLIVPALLILHISNPIGLMFVIFLFGLVPFVGHTISAAIVTLVALFHSIPSALAILAYYILYINIENYVIQPRLQSFTTNMSPLTVFGAVVIGVNFGGVIGGLLAIPAAGCVRVVVVDYIERRQLLAHKELGKKATQ